MSDQDISDQETPAPAAPGPATPAVDKAKVNPESQRHGAEYLDDKSSVMSPEALLDRFNELRETDDPVNAILVTEVQEVKEYLDSIHKAMTVGLIVVLLGVGAVAFIIDRRMPA